MKALFKKILTRIELVVACVLVLVGGVAALVLMPLLKQEPPKAKSAEQAIFVEAVAVQPEDVPVVLKGYGEVRVRNQVSITPEVPGRIAEVHPRMDVGEVIPKGEVLFRIEPGTYEAQLADSTAAARQLADSVHRLEVQYAADQARLETMQRTCELSKNEFERAKSLFEKDEVGTKSGVEQAEQAYNSTKDAVDQMESQLKVYPIQIAEAKSSSAAAEARIQLNALNLERTVVVAPFDARIVSQSVEAGQYVSPGAPVLELADDSLLEISTPLNSKEARNWLDFGGQNENDAAWFQHLTPLECTVQWTEDPGHHWKGTLHRVEKVDENTRTIYVAVRIEGAHALAAEGDGLPLVAGMFCEVGIPGKTLKQAYRLPRTAVSFEGTVHLVVSSGEGETRLKTAPVTLAYEEGGMAYVSEGLSPGDKVITTRLVNPLENALVQIKTKDAGEAAS